MLLTVFWCRYLVLCGFVWVAAECFVQVVLRLCCEVACVVWVRCMGVRCLANFGLIWGWWFWFVVLVPWWVVCLWFAVLVCRFWNVSLPMWVCFMCDTLCVCGDFDLVWLFVCLACVFVGLRWVLVNSVDLDFLFLFIWCFGLGL